MKNQQKCLILNVLVLENYFDKFCVALVIRNIDTKSPLKNTETEREIIIFRADAQTVFLISYYGTFL